MSSDTDLYLLPALARTVTATEVGSLLRAIHVSRVEQVTIYRSGEWDRNSAEQLESHQDQSIGDFAEISGGLGTSYALAQVESPILSLVQSIVAQHPDLALEWSPYDCLVHLGAHSLPDREFERTIWRGSVAVSLHGDRIPLIDELEIVLAEDREWQRVVSSVERALGSAVETRLVPYY